MRVRRLSAPFFALVLVLAACEGASDSGGADTTGGDVAEAAAFVVVVGGVETPADPDALPSVENPYGVDSVVLGDLLAAAAPGLDLAQYVCDFVSADGFRTSAKGEGCEPVPCDRTTKAWLELDSYNLVWDETLGMRGCYAARSLARVELTPAP